MNIPENRKKAFAAGLKKMKKQASLSRKTTTLGITPPASYNPEHMHPINEIVQGDCIATLNACPEGWVDLVFADPPFNIGYLYHGYDDKLKCEDYVKFSEDWMRAVYRALKPTGSFYLAIGDEYAADLCYVARRKIGFHMRNWIIWHYTFGQQTRKMFAKSHTHILYFTKQKPVVGEERFTFNADAVRVKSARQMVYEDVRANPKGKMPDDTWFLRPQETAGHAYIEPGYEGVAEESKRLGYFDPASDTWFVSRVCGTFTEREGWHGCQMPIAVLDRIIRASSNEGDIVLDPFNGSGTTAVSAALNNRRYVGIDQSAEYVAFAQKRLAHAKEAAAKQVGGAGAINDPNRASRVLTETDAFGRDRVPRGPRTRRPRKRDAGEKTLYSAVDV